MKLPPEIEKLRDEMGRIHAKSFEVVEGVRDV